MSSNLILKNEIVEKNINKKSCKRKGRTKKKMELKFDKKRPNKDEILKTIMANLKNYK